MLAFRSDTVSTVYQREVQELEQRLGLRPQRTIRCPVDGCSTTYEVFDAVETTHRKNVRELRAMLAKSHPHHAAADRIALHDTLGKAA